MSGISFLAHDPAFNSAQRAYDNRMPREDGPDYGEWLAKYQTDVLASDELLLEEHCWEYLKDDTLSLCLAFAWAGLTGQYRPMSLESFRARCAECEGTGALVEALECGDIITRNALALAVIRSQREEQYIPAPLFEVVRAYQQKVIAESECWKWLKESFAADMGLPNKRAWR